MTGEGRSPTDLGAGYKTLAVLLPLYFLALTVYTVRIWTRTRPKYRLNASDYMVTIAVVAEGICMILIIVAVSQGFGGPFGSNTPNQAEIVGRTTFSVYIISLWASAFARISVSCLLLRLTENRVWRAILWGTIVFQGLALLACDFSQLLQCRPIRAMWAIVPGSYCIPSDQLWILVCVFAGIGTTGDVACAILPMLIIWRLSRSRVEKTLVSVLMALGLLSALCGGFKLLILKKFDPTAPDALNQIMAAFIWIRVEEILLIIAACAPLLKSPIENLLHRRFGLPVFVPRPRVLNSMSMPTGEMPSSSGKAKYFGTDGADSESRAPASTELTPTRSATSNGSSHGAMQDK